MTIPPRERTVEVRGEAIRVWEKGDGEPLGVLAGLWGAPRWTPFFEALARERRLIVPSLPGFPGGGCAHERLDTVADWVAATLDILDAAGLFGADLVGISVGAMVAAETAALCPGAARRLVLVAPFGLFDDDAPVADVFAQLPRELAELLCADPARAARHLAVPDEDEVEWQVTATRAAAAAARLLWPLPDRGLRTRLHRVRCPVLVVWGDGDRVVPPVYARRFAARVGGDARVEMIEGAGHLVDLDAPERLASVVERFVSQRGN